MFPFFHTYCPSLRTFHSKYIGLNSLILFGCEWEYFLTLLLKNNIELIKGALEYPAGGENSIFNEIVKYGSNKVLFGAN